MSPGAGALIGLDQDHDIEPVGEFFMPHRQLIDGRLKMSFHDSGFEKG